MQLDAVALELIERTGLTAHSAALEQVALPGVGVRIRPLAGSAVATGSRFGGAPSLPPSTPWPEWSDEPVPFVCQIDLSEVAGYPAAAQLPGAGLLSFFYRHQTPAQIVYGQPEDAGAWRWLYVPAEQSGTLQPASSVQPPPVVYPERSLAFHAELTFPDVCPFDATQDEKLAYGTFVNEVSKRYAGDQTAWGFQAYGSHRLLGHWLGVQFGDPLAESQLASASQDWWRSPPSAPRTPEDWCMLFQLDYDYEAGLELAGSGMAHVCIPRQDLAARRLDRTWLIFKAT